jgi:hypothetical protein
MKELLIILLISGSLFAQEKILSLSESLEIGLKNSKDLKISMSKLNYADSKLSEINSQFLPQFKLFGNYTRLSDNIPSFEVTMPFSPTPIRISDSVNRCLQASSCHHCEVQRSRTYLHQNRIIQKKGMKLHLVFTALIGIFTKPMRLAKLSRNRFNKWKIT